MERYTANIKHNTQEIYDLIANHKSPDDLSKAVISLLSQDRFDNALSSGGALSDIYSLAIGYQDYMHMPGLADRDRSEVEEAKAKIAQELIQKIQNLCQR